MGYNKDMWGGPRSGLGTVLVEDVVPNPVQVEMAIDALADRFI